VLLCSSRSATRWVSNRLFVCLGRGGGGVAQWGVARRKKWGSGKAEKGEVGDLSEVAKIHGIESVELEGRERGRGNRSVTHVFETFLGEDGVQ
jgi:hypothetical protein